MAKAEPSYNLKFTPAQLVLELGNSEAPVQEGGTRMEKEISLRDRAYNNLKLLKRLCDGFITTDENGFGRLVNYSTLSDEPVHRWFRYREGYSIQLVKKLIQGLPKGSLILDPFCGCGTTLVAAQEIGFESYGFDINPLSVFVSEVKTTIYSSNETEEIEKHRKRALKLTPSSPSDPPPILNIIDKLFHPKVLAALLVIRRFINSIENVSEREFLKLAWLSILEEVSNVFKEGNGIKYRNRKRTPKGYITIQDEEWQRSAFPHDKFDYIKERFSEQVTLMLKDVAQRPKKLPKTHVFEMSAEAVDSVLKGNSVSYIVFSPPYCNCFNYFKIFKVELWMGGFVNTYKDMQALTRKAMRSHVETIMDRENDRAISYVDEFADLIDIEQLWDKRIPKAVKGYFIDMDRILGSLYNVLKPGGKCVIVVGNSAYSGILIPTDALLATIASELGYKVEKISVARHLTTSSQQKLKLEDRKQYLRESLVVLKKPDPRLEEKHLKYVGEIPLDVETSYDKVFVIRNNGLCNLTHKFHRFPGKFIPHIPRWAVTKYLEPNSEQSILDPFCGSGTTLVEGLLMGYNAYGIDIDPIARLISCVKTTPINTRLLGQCVQEIKQKIWDNDDGEFRPSIPTLKHWFNEQAIRDLSVIRDAIEGYREKTSLYEFLLVCFLSIIRRSSNADNQTQKTYVSHTLKKKPENAKHLFEKALDDYSKRLKGFMERLPPNKKSTVLSFTDSRVFAEMWQGQGLPKIDLGVTSPPYVKTVDYVYNQMAEYFWIGDLYDMETQQKQNKYKRCYIGSEKVNKSEYDELRKTGIRSIDTITEKVFSKSKKHAYITQKYFNDMLLHLGEMRKILKQKAHYIMVVGDSLISNEAIPCHLLIQHCAVETGYDVCGVFGYEIRNRHMRFPRIGRGGIVRYDWVIDLKQKS
jgi:hypothetical protein